MLVAIHIPIIFKTTWEKTYPALKIFVYANAHCGNMPPVARLVLKSAAALLRL